ncbi:MAG: UDP-glucose/GDP-mannose dehydrogenase family protein [Verrucomicrobiota bacterium]
MKISIFGLGYVGCVGMACLAEHGHHLIGVDPQSSKVDALNQGLPTIIEKDLAPLLAKLHAAGHISATSSVTEAIAQTNVSFICVGTPSTPNGHLDLSAIHTVASQIATALLAKPPSRHLIALRSTVLPGTNALISQIIADLSHLTPNVDFAVVSNPEFLREGSSVHDFSHPAFTLVGTDCPWAADLLRDLYSPILAPFIVTTPKVAELMKYACNSFHALKITFANEVGNICKKLEIDSHQLMDIFCQDSKLNLSSAYLKPGFAYGGSCLPKDLRALQTIAHDFYLQTPLLSSIELSNQSQKDLVFRQILDFNLQNIAFLGLAFKAGTDDLRDSPIIDVIERLLGKGFQLKIYDPHVHLAQLTGANRQYILQRIPFISRFITDDLDATIRDSQLLVIVNQSPNLAATLATSAAGKKIYDLAGLRPVGCSAADYSGISW